MNLVLGVNERGINLGGSMLELLLVRWDCTYYLLSGQQRGGTHLRAKC
jgi:hypothetical protein